MSIYNGFIEEYQGILIFKYIWLVLRVWYIYAPYIEVIKTNSCESSINLSPNPTCVFLWYSVSNDKFSLSLSQ